MKTFIFTTWCWTTGERVYISYRSKTFKMAYVKALSDVFETDYLEEGTLEYYGELNTHLIEDGWYIRIDNRDEDEVLAEYPVHATSKSAASCETFNISSVTDPEKREEE